MQDESILIQMSVLPSLWLIQQKPAGLPSLGRTDQSQDGDANSCWRALLVSQHDILRSSVWAPQFPLSIGGFPADLSDCSHIDNATSEKGSFYSSLLVLKGCLWLPWIPGSMFCTEIKRRGDWWVQGDFCIGLGLQKCWRRKQKHLGTAFPVYRHSKHPSPRFLGIYTFFKFQSLHWTSCSFMHLLSLFLFLSLQWSLGF